MSAGKFFVIVAWSAASPDVPLDSQSRETEGGVHWAEAFTCDWHCAWHSALALHEGGVT